MKATFNLPDSLYKEFHEYASKNKLSMTKIIEDLIRQSLSSQKIPKQPFLKDASFKGDGYCEDFNPNWENIRHEIYKKRGE